MKRFLTARLVSIFAQFAYLLYVLRNEPRAIACLFGGIAIGYCLFGLLSARE